MNERIKELKLKAIKLVAESYPTKIEDFTDGLDERVREKAEEKFAELIVRECLMTIDDEIGRLTEYSNSIDDEYMKHNVDICIEKCLDNIHNIKEHFGVEE